MKPTVFSPTEMRWPLSRALALTIAASACTSTSTFYVPSAGAERLSQNQLRDRADAMLSIECPRILGGRPSAFGVAEVVVDVDASGAVTRAKIAQSSGDRRADEIFGALAAQLKLDPPGASSAQGPLRGDLSIGYSCSPGAAVTSIELNKGPSRSP